jgi:plastocyanin
VLRESFLKRIASSKSVSAVLPIFVVVALVLVILAGYYVAIVLPGSLPTSTTSTGITYTSTLTGNLTSQGVAYVSLPTRMVNYSTIFIQDGASLGKVTAFNPWQATVVIGVNNTVIWKNADDVTQSFAATNGLFTSGNLTALFGTFRYTFTTPGVYSYASSVYPWENGTVTVVS